LENGELREEFDVKDGYDRPTGIRFLPFFRIAVNCHEDYMLILHFVHKIYAKLVSCTSL
jgi:hypothetical protein